MSDFRKELAAKFRARPPKVLDDGREMGLSESSIKTYVSSVYNLLKKAGLALDMSTFDKEGALEVMLQRLKGDMNEHSRKSRLAALFVLTGDLRFLADMKQSIQAVRERYATRKLTPKEATHRVSQDEIHRKFKEARSAFRRDKNRATAQSFLIAGLTSGFYPGLPPRRNEYCDVKLKDYDATTDNYLKGNVIVLNKYKTFYLKGRQTVEVPRPLREALSVLVAEADGNPYLFFHKNGKKFTSSQWTKNLYRIYGDGIGTDALRSIYWSATKCGTLADVEKIADKMGHTVNQALLTYLKV
jgi:hypothetical protein